MKRMMIVFTAAALLASNPAQAQDIAGIEDCSKTSGLDRRTGCFQSNIEFLHRLITKHTTELQQKVSAAHAEIGELKRAVAGLQTSLAKLQTSIEQLQQAAKKPEAK